MKHKLWTWAGIAFVVFFIVKDPSGAATTANGIGSGLASTATAVGNFLTALTAGGAQ